MKALEKALCWLEKSRTKGAKDKKPRKKRSSKRKFDEHKWAFHKKREFAHYSAATIGRADDESGEKWKGHIETMRRHREIADEMTSKLSHDEIFSLMDKHRIQDSYLNHDTYPRGSEFEDYDPAKHKKKQPVPQMKVYGAKGHLKLLKR